jgi:hypothetical protein
MQVEQKKQADLGFSPGVNGEGAGHHDGSKKRNDGYYLYADDKQTTKQACCLLTSQPPAVTISQPMTSKQ